MHCNGQNLEMDKMFSVMKDIHISYKVKIAIVKKFVQTNGFLFIRKFQICNDKILNDEVPQ